jgi:hypothetical protein
LASGHGAGHAGLRASGFWLLLLLVIFGRVAAFFILGS